MAKEPSATASNTGGAGLHTGSTAGFLRQALDAYEDKCYARAELILGQIVEQQPHEGPAWHLRGINAAAADDLNLATRCFINAANSDTENAQYCVSLAMHLARVDLDHAAVDSWQRAVDLVPDNPAYRAELAQCLSRIGRFGDALPHFDAASRLRPDDSRLLAAYGSALLSTGDQIGAISRFEAAFAAAPTDPEIAFRLGYALHHAGRTSEAADLYRDALALDPGLHEARLNLSACQRDLGDNEAAIEGCQMILARQPDSVGALNNLGTALCAIGRNVDAIAVFETALTYEPDNLNTLHDLGVALHAQNAWTEAEACFRKCLRLRPNWHEAHRSLANLFRGCGRLSEAARHYQAVLDSRPLDFKSYANLGLVLLNLNEPQDAISVYEKAVALGHDHPELRVGLGVAQLATGDFANGWNNYEARLLTAEGQKWRPNHALPQWQGQSARSDNGTQPTVLIHAEQGFGDTIQFCRYLPLAAARGVKVIFECPAPLTSLMKTLSSSAGPLPFPTIDPGDTTPSADFHAPLLSLPRLFTSCLDQIPADTPYLAAPQDKKSGWSDYRFGDKPSIGLVWAGNPNRQDDQMRSCPLDALAPIVETHGATFFSLQKNAPRHLFPNIVDLGPRLDDFGDTAAIVEHLDLVISVDTAVAHLAGALGKPVWVMLGFAADWRYLLDREDSPWYPTMRLFRQPKSGDWHSVSTRIAQELHKFLTGHRYRRD